MQFTTINGELQISFPSYYIEQLTGITYYRALISPTQQEWAVYKKGQKPFVQTITLSPEEKPLGYYAEEISFEKFSDAYTNAFRERLESMQAREEETRMNRMDDEAFSQVDPGGYSDIQYSYDVQDFVASDGAVIDWDSMPDTPPPSIDDFEEVIHYETVLDHMEGLRLDFFKRRGQL